MNRFDAQNPYCTEAETAIQALQNAVELCLDVVEFEGDACNVILALHGMEQYEDWRAMQNLITGRKLRMQHSGWTLRHVYRECNGSAHNLAQWAVSRRIIRSLDVTTLPPTIWCDRGGT